MLVVSEMRLLGDRLFVVPEKDEIEYKSGLIVVQDNKKSVRWAVVNAVSDKLRREHEPCLVGLRILIPGSCIGLPMCVGGLTGTIIELSDVILVEEDDTYSCECTGTGVPSEFPFTCPHGKVWSPYRCVSDRILVYPKPKPEKVGDLYLPEGNFVGGGTAKAMWEPQGTVIARGYGSYDQHTKKYSPYDVACGDEVVFTKNIPQGWFFELPGKDGKMYQVAYMGYADIHVKKG